MFLDKFIRKCTHRLEIHDFQTLIPLLRYNLRESSPKYDHVMQINQSYNLMKHRFMTDAITYQAYKTAEEKIIFEVRQIVEQLQQADLRRRANAVHREVKFPVLVIASSSSMVDYDSLLFELLNFTKREVVFTANYHQTDAQIIVFHHQDVSEEQREQRLRLIQKYVDAQKYVIHFGEKWEALDAFPHQVFQVTNKLDLSTQLDQLIQFIETYQT